MKDVVTQILEWLERVLPGLIAAFGLGYKIGDDGKRKLQGQLDETETELKLKENELQNEKDFAGKSSADIIRDAAKGSGNKSESK